VSETGSDLSADVGVKVTYGLQAALSWGLNQRTRGGHGAVDGAPARKNTRKLIMNRFFSAHVWMFCTIVYFEMSKIIV
jgi:hypothetical protein